MATFDLGTGESYAPRPSDYITKITGCACAPPGTPHPVWTAFLERIAPDPELRAFLQRFIGYSLTGLTREHKFVFAYGTGANGKGTFINTIAAILGDYATVADVGTFIAAATERHPTDVAKLHGYRLVVAQETEKGRRWDETKIKSMTGGDKMTARFLRCDFFDFVPKFKLWIVGNHKPRLDNVDEAMRRRMLMVGAHIIGLANGQRLLRHVRGKVVFSAPFVVALLLAMASLVAPQIYCAGPIPSSTITSIGIAGQSGVHYRDTPLQPVAALARAAR